MLQLKKVSFTTTSSEREIKRALLRIGDVKDITVHNIITAKTKQSRRPWTDRQQLAAIWGAAGTCLIILMIFIEWGTRP